MKATDLPSREIRGWLTQPAVWYPLQWILQTVLSTQITHNHQVGSVRRPIAHCTPPKFPEERRRPAAPGPGAAIDERLDVPGFLSKDGISPVGEMARNFGVLNTKRTDSGSLAGWKKFLPGSLPGSAIQDRLIVGPNRARANACARKRNKAPVCRSGDESPAHHELVADGKLSPPADLSHASRAVGVSVSSDYPTLHQRFRGAAGAVRPDDQDVRIALPGRRAR